MNSELQNKLYESVQEENEERVYEHFHASSIAICPRAHYFKRLGIRGTDDPGAGKILRWAVGHKVEEAIRPHLEKLYPNLESNVRMTSEELDLTGEFDNYNPDANELIEIKSVHPYALKHLEKSGEPHLHYLWQQHSYKILMDKPVDWITFVYIALDGRIMTFTVKPNPVIERQVEERIELLRDAWIHQEPPECICTINGKQNKNHPMWGPQLQYCDYKQNGGCCSLELLNQYD